MKRVVCILLCVLLMVSTSLTAFAYPNKSKAETGDSGLWVVADGNWYAVEKDQVIDYVYYLNTGEKVCSLDAETYYDADGLQRDSYTNYNGFIFPIIQDAVVLNSRIPGQMKYNYSSAKGKNFDNDDSRLIHIRFNVSADTGVFFINTYLHTVAGYSEHKYIFKDKSLDPLKRTAGLVLGETPVINHPNVNPPTVTPSKSLPIVTIPQPDIFAATTTKTKISPSWTRPALRTSLQTKQCTLVMRSLQPLTLTATAN